jgi:integrase
MSDIRKRVGSKGTTYQVRYPSKKTKSGYAFSTFKTLKEARAYRDSISHSPIGPIDPSIQTVDQAIQKWLEICEKEGLDGRDPVTPYTVKSYEYRAEIMEKYQWQKELCDLTAPDIVKFRSWLLNNCSRDQARKTLSSFNSLMKEMALRGHIISNVAASVAIRAVSRYDKPVEIPTLADVAALLTAADRLANSKNRQIARTWERYRPMLYLAADSGMRPQEYVAVSKANLFDGGIKVDRALERGSTKVSVTKTPAGRRFIDLSPETFDMVAHFADNHAAASNYDLIFPTASGECQNTDNWRKRGFYAACFEAGLIDVVHEGGCRIEKPKYKPYDLRHFYASMLIEQHVNLKRIQTLMGHEDIKTTLNVYGHIIERADARKSEKINMVSLIAAE